MFEPGTQEPYLGAAVRTLGGVDKGTARQKGISNKLFRSGIVVVLTIVSQLFTVVDVIFSNPFFSAGLLTFCILSSPSRTETSLSKRCIYAWPQTWTAPSSVHLPRYAPTSQTGECSSTFNFTCVFFCFPSRFGTMTATSRSTCCAVYVFIRCVGTLVAATLPLFLWLEMRAPSFMSCCNISFLKFPTKF